MPTPTSIKIDRDYNAHGEIPQFITNDSAFPLLYPSLSSALSTPTPTSPSTGFQLLQTTIETINTYLLDSESLDWNSFFETCFGCFCLWDLIGLRKTRGQKVVERMEEFIRNENEKVYHPRGLHVVVSLGLVVLFRADGL